MMPDMECDMGWEMVGGRGRDLSTCDLSAVV